MARVSSEREWLQRQREKERRDRLGERQAREDERRGRRGGLLRSAVGGIAISEAMAPGRMLAGGMARAGGAAARASGGMITRGLAGLGGMAGKLPMVGGMATRMAGMVGGGAAATGVLALAAAAVLAAKAAVKMTNSHVRMTEEYVKSRKVYQVGAAFGMGLGRTGVEAAGFALAATKGAVGIGGVAVKQEERHIRAQERFKSTAAGIVAQRGLEAPGVAVKWGLEAIKEGYRRQAKWALKAYQWAGIAPSGEDIEAEVEAARARGFRGDREAMRREKLLKDRFPMLKHEFARGTAQEGFYPRGDVTAVSFAANPMYRGLIAVIEANTDAVNRWGRLLP